MDNFDPTAILDRDPSGLLQQSMAEFDARESAEKAVADLRARSAELHAYLRGWLASSMAARRANYEDNWNRWRRNARNIYDPARKARKERWQSTMFVPISMQTKEVIKSQLYRSLIAGLPYSLKPLPSGSQDEATAIKTLLLRELRKARIELAANDVFDDVTTYGVGFLKMFWDSRTRKRSRRVPEYPSPSLEGIAQIQAGAPLPQPLAYNKGSPEDVVVFNGISTWHVSVWDIFFADRAKDLSGPVCQRYRLSYQEILDGARKGWYFQDAAWVLRDVREPNQAPLDRQQEEADLHKSQLPVPRQLNEKQHTVYEYWGLLPQKFVFIRPDEISLITDPEELIPAKALFTAEALLDIAENPDEDSSNPYIKAGYLRVPGTVYDIGIMEMIEQLQDDTNETTNQRKDNVNLILNRMGAILESSIVSKADLVSRPGGFVRIKRGSSDDVSKAITWMQVQDVTQSSYLETAHNERFAQELTGATRVMIGTAGSQAKDVTQTKGGMEIVRQSSSDRLIYYAMLIEADFITALIKRAYALIYANTDPQTIARILGPLMQFFRMRLPEEIEQDYVWEPEGVFSAMHQPVRIAQWQAFRDQYNGAPFFDDLEMSRILARAIELPDQDKVLVPMRDPQTGQIIPFQMMQQMSLLAQRMTAMPLPPEGPGKVGARKAAPTIPTSKVGEHGERQVP